MILSVDLGSTRFKAALFGEDGTRLADEAIAVPYLIKSPTRTELLPESVWEAFVHLCRSLMDKVPGAPGQVRSVAVTSQAQTFCLLDQDHQPQSPFISWIDTRPVDEAATLDQEFGPAFHRHTGWPGVSPALTISKILWWQKHQAWDPNSRLVTLPSYLALRMGSPFALDLNIGVMTGLASVRIGDWWDEACERVNLRPEQLGQIVPLGSSTPIQSGEISLAADARWVWCGNDHTAGAVGADCRENMALLTLGTTGIVYRRTGDTPGPYSGTGIWGPFWKGGHYELLCLEHACSAIDWVREQIAPQQTQTDFDKAARKAENKDSAPYFHPWFWGQDSAWSGEGNQAQRAYASTEGVAFALRHLVEEADIDLPPRLGVLGGGGQLPTLLQCLASALDRELVLASGDGLLGAARMAGLNPERSGRDEKSPTAAKPDSKERERLQRRYPRWLEAWNRKRERSK